MAIPVYLQNFKAAGVYRVVFDKSTVEGVDAQKLRLVVGYSEVGPFNTPVYIEDQQAFRTLFGGISRKLERRGVFFHRMCLQALQAGPIIALNLKRFDGETVDGATISTDFNPYKMDPITTVRLKVEDIYDTTRFWTLDAEKLNNMYTDDGKIMSEYINISQTEADPASMTYFIRKASGDKVSQYNITVSDWYGNEDDIPEFLKDFKQNLISDFFAEIYVFKGKFKSNQVMASDTLKNYFTVAADSVTGEKYLKLRPYVIDAYGEAVDTLDLLYQDETSNAVGHWVGCLIPQFKTKQGVYVSLDIIFNQSQDEHGLMMSFNTDLLDGDIPSNIDLSGRMRIPTADMLKQKNRDTKKIISDTVSLENLSKGTATTTVLGNKTAPVISDHISFGVNAVTYENGKAVPMQQFTTTASAITGTMYVNAVDTDNNIIGIKVIGGIPGQSSDDSDTSSVVISSNGSDAGSDSPITITVKSDIVITCNDNDELFDVAQRLGVKPLDYDSDGNVTSLKIGPEYNGYGTYWMEDEVFPENDPLRGPEQVITSITRLENDTYAVQQEDYTDIDANLKAAVVNVTINTAADILNTVEDGSERLSVYPTSVSFIDVNSWDIPGLEETVDTMTLSDNALVSHNLYDSSLIQILQPGDCLLADDSQEDGIAANYYYNNVYVTDTGTVYKDSDKTEVDFYYVIFSGKPLVNDGQIVRIDNALNQEIGDMVPQYLEGYKFKNLRPNGTGMWAKLEWQHLILSALTDYKGLRTGLLNKSEIDYRYIVDTFESYPETGLKDTLSLLAKDKQSALCIANFPAVQTFVKCPYISFLNSSNVFDVDYIVAGYNKKKAASTRFSLPTEVNGASFVGFYTPLKFSDGYIDYIIPSAALVSNLFIEKYNSRQPYYIVAGPNYGKITADGLTGPDYHWSQDELNVIEPYGVNCMVYRPGFGTFINANQTAKQTPVSALSRVNIRELVIYLQDEIEKVLQAYQWEFNNETTRNAILDKADQICSLVQANGGIQTFKNIMDESNNTPEIIDNEMAVLSTYIEPGYGCGKMVQELTLYRTGQMSSEIIS